MKTEYFTRNDSQLPYYPMILLNQKDIRFPIKVAYVYGVMFDKLKQDQSDEDGRLYILYDFAAMLEDTRAKADELNRCLGILETENLIERTSVPGMIYLKKCS